MTDAFTVLSTEQLATMDAADRRCDAFLHKRALKHEQQRAQPEIMSPQPVANPTAGWQEYIERRITERLDAEIDELRRQVIELVEVELNRVIDDTSAELKAIVTRILDLEIANRALNAEKANRTSTELKDMREMLEGIVMRMDAAARGENIVPLRSKAN